MAIDMKDRATYSYEFKYDPFITEILITQATMSQDTLFFRDNWIEKQSFGCYTTMLWWFVAIRTISNADYRWWSIFENHWFGIKIGYQWACKTI